MRRYHRLAPQVSAWGLPLVLLFLVIWAGPALGSDAHPVPHGEGRMWRIERGDAPPSYIMGTIHVADPRVRDLPAPIRKAFEGSEQAAFELLMSPEELETLRQARRLPRGGSLGQLVDHKTYKKAVAMAARYGIPAKAADQMQPAALAALFQTPPDEFRRRVDGDLVLDLWLIQWAYDLGKRVVELEKLQEQMALLERSKPKDQVKMLRSVLAQLEKDPNALEHMIDDYLAGRMAPHYRRVEEAARKNKEPGAREFKEAFLDKRNHTMVKRMIPLLDRGKAFIAVGALHMPGEQGILSLLEQRGYRITRVY